MGPTRPRRAVPLVHPAALLVVALAAAPVAASCVAPVAPPASAAPAARSAPPPFRFTTDGFWLNLHHFLYVLGRAEAGARDAGRRAVADAPADQERGLATLAEPERLAWREAVAFYATGPSELDAVFDAELVETTRALAAAAGPSVAGVAIEPSWRAVLERAAPVYRAAWWPAHRAANERRVAALRPLIDRHGAGMLALITGWYGRSWPADGYPVQVSAFSNWSGAYSTTGDLLVVASLDPGLEGSSGLEIVFHEAMHQWDAEIDAALAAAALAQGVDAPEDLSHAMIFYTAGEAARRTIPGHVPYAEQAGIWQRRLGTHKPALDTAWRPYLDGKGTLAEALAALVRAAGTP